MARKSLTGFDSNNKPIVNVADPSNLTDATNKQYVDNKIDGLAYKDEVRAATTTSGTLASAFAAGQSIDGYTLVTGDRILIKDQSTPTENGIYVVAGSGAPTRSGDGNSTADLNNATVLVTQGTVNGGREYTQTTKDPVLGTSSIVWAQKQSGVTYTADGNGLEMSGQQFSLELDGTSLQKSASGLRIGSAAAANGLVESGGLLSVGAGTGISVGADTVGIDTSVVTRKVAFDSTATNPQTVTHGLGTADLDVSLREVSTGALVDADVTITSTQVTVNYGGTPTAGQYRIVIHG